MLLNLLLIISLNLVLSSLDESVSQNQVVFIGEEGLLKCSFEENKRLFLLQRHESYQKEDIMTDFILNEKYSKRFEIFNSSNIDDKSKIIMNLKIKSVKKEDSDLYWCYKMFYHDNTLIYSFMYLIVVDQNSINCRLKVSDHKGITRRVDQSTSLDIGVDQKIQISCSFEHFSGSQSCNLDSFWSFEDKPLNSIFYSTTNELFVLLITIDDDFYENPFLLLNSGDLEKDLNSEKGNEQIKSISGKFSLSVIFNCPKNMDQEFKDSTLIYPTNPSKKKNIYTSPLFKFNLPNFTSFPTQKPKSTQSTSFTPKYPFHPSKSSSPRIGYDKTNNSSTKFFTFWFFLSICIILFFLVVGLVIIILTRTKKRFNAQDSLTEFRTLNTPLSSNLLMTENVVFKRPLNNFQENSYNLQHPPQVHSNTSSLIEQEHFKLFQHQQRQQQIRDTEPSTPQSNLHIPGFNPYLQFTPKLASKSPFPRNHGESETTDLYDSINDCESPSLNYSRQPKRSLSSLSSQKLHPSIQPSPSSTLPRRQNPFDPQNFPNFGNPNQNQTSIYLTPSK